MDPQAAGALLCRRLCVGHRGLIESATAAVDLGFACSKRQNITSTARCREPPPAIPRQPASGSSIWTLSLRITSSSRSGRRIARRISRTAPRWSAPRSPALKGRELDAERLYEQAIRSARANGFIHNEALANELAARFYAARGFEKIAHVYLQDARYGYLRWGADGKVRQLDRAVSAPQGGRASARSDRHDRGAGRTPRPRDRDQGVAGRLGRDRAGEAASTRSCGSAIEQAGAERGLLILFRKRRATDRGGSHDRSATRSKSYSARRPVTGRRCRNRSSTTSCAPGRA